MRKNRIRVYLTFRSEIRDRAASIGGNFVGQTKVGHQSDHSRDLEPTNKLLKLNCDVRQRSLTPYHPFLLPSFI